MLPDIRQLPDAGYPAGYPASAGRIIRHAGYPAKGKIRPDNPALPDIRPNPNLKFTNVYVYICILSIY